MFKKSLIVVMCILAFIGVANAQDNWHTANQVTVGWDAVTTLSNGDPIPENPPSTITYNVYIKNVGTQIEEISVSDISGLEATITFTTEGSYLIGCQAVRTVEGVPDPYLSIIVWSDDIEVVLNGNTFGIRFFSAPGVVTGVHISQ